MNTGESKASAAQDPVFPRRAPVFALVAGEDSGDQLGAELIAALRALHPDARFVGVGGTRMREVGFEAWHDISELSVMGLAEVLRHLPRLLKLRSTLAQRLRDLKPDVFIGIDAPDFNLGLERRLKDAGIRTVHYVSPSIWAWREQRAAKIGASADRVLCLFPMEPGIYEKYGVDARFVGHPLADRFPLVNDREAARGELELPQDTPVLAVLPGSRHAEIQRLGAIFLEAAARIQEEIPELRIVIPAASTRRRSELAALVASARFPGRAPVLIDGRSHRAMAAADVVLLASGTAALEAMLAKRPMVVAYRIAPLTYRVVRGLHLLRTDLFSLPNVLAAHRLVPELMQGQCTAENLAAEVLRLFREPARRELMVGAFERMHLSLHVGGGAATAAARAIDELLPAC
ncbi:MAG TPA: lipid-A-disaccharide synthase [Rhodanobacteraceae bacterium]|nr:lipid-A-disaccharide synthase [Rhodanobacteraceae bacterium]